MISVVLGLPFVPNKWLSLFAHNVRSHPFIPHHPSIFPHYLRIRFRTSTFSTRLSALMSTVHLPTPTHSTIGNPSHQDPLTSNISTFVDSVPSTIHSQTSTFGGSSNDPRPYFHLVVKFIWIYMG